MDNLTIIGLFLNTIGSIILAIALNKTTKMLDTSITALEHFKDTYLRGGDVLSFTGMDTHRKKALKNSKVITNIGLTLLILGFVLQIISLTANQTCP
ncbi:MAG: hypothetical protein IPN57_03245 [Ignavibacteria bacterium]|nr:hypothetical protein [Ignavibacteria bacterium]